MAGDNVNRRVTDADIRRHAYAVIMAGGRGERFWPLSTSKHPKQVLSLVGRKPLVAMAVEYLNGLIPPDRVFVVTGRDLVGVTRRAVPRIPKANIIGEPVGRDTAAVCALGSALVRSRDPEGAFCVLTADHVIGDVGRFRATIRESFRVAMETPALVTIGMQPTGPHTGFGYIELGARSRRAHSVDFFNARRFVEKPDAATARRYVRSRRFLWNGGMFIWSVRSLDAALAAHVPLLHDMSERLAGHVGTPSFAAALAREYRSIGRISVDYALMEKARNIVVARGTFRWDDVGAWPALANHFKADPSGNVCIGDCVTMDSVNNIVVSQGRVTALLGVRDLVIVHADGATLICDRTRAQEVKKIVGLLGACPRYRKVL